MGKQLENALLNAGLTDQSTRPWKLSLRCAGSHRRRIRAGPGQRWSGPSGRLLHRLPRLPRRAGIRLRHPVQVRHLQAGIRRERQADRDPGLLAGQRGAVGPHRLQPRSEGLLRRRSRRGERQEGLEAGLVRARRPGRLHGSGLRLRPCEHPASVDRQELRRVRPAHLQQVRVP